MSRRVATVLTALALGVAGTVALPASPASAACPTPVSGSRWIGAFTYGAGGSNWSEGVLNATGSPPSIHITGSLSTINGFPQPQNQINATLNCNSITGTLTGLAGVITFSATAADNGNEFYGGQWGNGQVGGQFSSARVIDTASEVSDTLTTDDNSTGATVAEPVQVAIQSPTVGNLSIDTGSANLPVVAGYQLLDQVVHITAPTATAVDPLVFTFVLDSTVVAPLTPAQVEVFRNGTLVDDCSPTAGSAASPDPCVAARTLLAGGDVQFTVRTSAASTWTFGASTTIFGLRILNASLPPAKLGVAYSASLFASGGTEPYKFKKLTKLPKGLKLKAKTGVISGTPKKVTGTFPFRVLVIDKAKPKRSASKTFFVVVS